MNYDPDRDLWLPSRRKFFFLGLAAGVAPFLPDVPKWSQVLHVEQMPPPHWTVELEMQTIGGEWQKINAMFEKADPSRPFRVLVNGGPIPVDACPITISRGPGPVVGFGSDDDPSVRLKRYPSKPCTSAA